MKLNGKKVAILATDGFEQSELFSPKDALEKAGAEVHIISNKPGSIKGWKDGDWGKSITVDYTLEKTSETYYNALVLPGGVINPDTMRMEEKAMEFIRNFFRSGKPVAAICHAPQLLIEADVIENRKVTSWPSIKTDLINAGAQWVDEEVVVDQGLVTSRKPDDLPAFNRKLVEEVMEGMHEGQVVNA